MKRQTVELKIWGDLACFTRPETKVERVSYPVMTPSAARGVLESIMWKPEIQWQVREISVLRPIRHLSILRNEVSTVASVASAQKWSVAGGGFYAEDDRQQRHTLALRDVGYIIRAVPVLVDPDQPHGVTKYVEIFKRRVERGQCFHRPYLGCREFAAHFGVPNGYTPIDLDDDLGLILFDLDYADDKSGRGTPRFFHAKLEKGVLRIPADLYREVSHVAQSAC